MDLFPGDEAEVGMLNGQEIEVKVPFGMFGNVSMGDMNMTMNMSKPMMDGDADTPTVATTKAIGCGIKLPPHARAQNES